MRSKVLVLFLIPLALLAGALPGYKSALPSVHAASTSEVCLADPGFTPPPLPAMNECPLAQQNFMGPNATHVGAQLRVNVNANGTGAMNGFDIILVADHAKLQPFGADISNSIVTGSTVLKECVGGIPLIGQCDAQDNPDTVHLFISGAFTSPPSFGILFTAIYNIVGNTTATGIPVGFQTGCTAALTSRSPFCVTLTSGGGIPTAVSTLQSATYTTTTTSPFQPFFYFKTKPLVLNYTKGTGTGANSNITMVESDSFTCGGVTCVNMGFIKPAVNGLTVGLNVTQISDPPASGVRLSVNINTLVPAGIYTIFVTGTPVTGGNAPLTGTTYLGAITSITLTVVAASDFAIASNPSTIIANIQTLASSAVLVAGGKTFTNPVALSSSTSPSAGLMCSLSPASVTPATTPSLTESTLSCTSSSGGVYTVTVTGTSGSLVHSTTITFIVGPFSMSANPTSLSIKPGGPGTSTISLHSIEGFSGTVTLTTSISSPLPSSSVSLNPSSLMLSPGLTSSSTLTVTLPSTAGGTYTVNVTATSGTVSQQTSITVTTGNANMIITSVSASTISATVGDTVTVTVMLNNTGTVAGNFSIWINWGTIKVAGPVNDTIPAGKTKTETLTWNTAGFAAGSNTIVAVLSTTGGVNGPGSQSNGQSVALSGATPLSSVALIGIVSGIIAAIIIAALLVIVLRRRKRTPTL